MACLRGLADWLLGTWHLIFVLSAPFICGVEAVQKRQWLIKSYWSYDSDKMSFKVKYYSGPQGCRNQHKDTCVNKVSSELVFRDTVISAFVAAPWGSERCHLGWSERMSLGCLFLAPEAYMRSVQIFLATLNCFVPLVRKNRSCQIHWAGKLGLNTRGIQVLLLWRFLHKEKRIQSHLKWVASELKKKMYSAI